MTFFAKQQVAWKLKCVTEEQGCRVALMAALFKSQMMNELAPGSVATIREIADNPKKFTWEQCHSAYWLLGDIREAARQELRLRIANKSIPPPEVRLQMEICDLALSLWMATIGVGCTSGGLKAVSCSWKFIASLAVAECDILRLRNEFAHFGESALEPFAALETGEWIALARKIPEFLSEQRK